MTRERGGLAALPRLSPPLLAATAILLAAVFAYHNSFQGVFLLDDAGSIQNNPTIRRLWPPWPALSPPPDQTVGGRPVVNLTLALNYAIGGLDPRGYHAVNLAVHVLAALALLGLVRRTLLLPRLAPRLGPDALPIAFSTALLWAVHPLQTESVSYIVQRCEALGSLWYLLVLYAAVRALDPGGAGRWQAASVAACLLGMATKEIVFSAPAMVVLFDRTFWSSSFREAWRRRRGFYLALASGWLLLGYQVVQTGHRGNSILFELSARWVKYVLTQFVAVATYLRLAVWPSPLVFDYGYALAEGAAVWLSAGVVLTLLGATVVAIRRGHPAGFPAALFFVVLASSSSLLPVRTQPVAEHRMYLPLAPVVLLAVAGFSRAWGRRIPVLAGRPAARRLVPAILVTGLALGLGALTVRRNEDYRSAVAMWQDTVRKRPANPRAHNNLAESLLLEGRAAEAVEHYRRVLALGVELFTVQRDLGAALAAAGRHREAVEAYRRSIELNPSEPDSRSGLAFALLKAGRPREAVAQFEVLAGARPDDAGAHFNLAAAQLETGDFAGAAGHLRTVVRLDPGHVKAYNNLGHALNSLGRAPEALPPLAEAVRLDPKDYFARFNYGLSLAATGDTAAARGQLGIAEQLARAAGDQARSGLIRDRLRRLR